MIGRTHEVLASTTAVRLAPVGQDDWTDGQGHSLWHPTAFPDWLGGDSETVARRLLGCYLVRDLPIPMRSVNSTGAAGHGDGKTTRGSGASQGKTDNSSCPAGVSSSSVRVVVRIVETEAYDQDDPASHAYHGRSERNRALFGPSGRCYVYFTYGMWHCLNVSCGADGYGAGALIRAVQPVVGGDLLEHRRGTDVTTSGSTVCGSNVDCGSTARPVRPARLSRRVQALDGPARLATALDIDKRLYGHDLHEPPLQLMEGGLRPGEHVETTIRIGITRAVERRRRYLIAGNPWVSKMPPKTRRLSASLGPAD